jgi:exodeoxyribonuclease VII large subunit
MSSSLVTNVPEWGVSDLAQALKRTVEEAYGHVRLRGEISGYRGPHSSGHVYFSLKDANARIDAVMWKGAFQKLRTRPEEGMEVIATGRITTFAGKSSYQIVIETLEPAGAGALMALLEQRKTKLAAEGLFAEARKRPLPYLPRRIGVITSPTGAVIRDILHRLEERFPRPVLIWPVRVQGENSAAEVTAAIEGFNRMPEKERPDVLIVARGGGSIEDLWGFNDEALVRMVAASLIPVISAVGHETDWTLIDLVADRRAPTPTAAAEIAVPVHSELLSTLRDLVLRRDLGWRRGQERRITEVRALARAIPSPEAFLALRRQRLDLASSGLKPSVERVLSRASRICQEGARKVQKLSPAFRLAQWRGRMEALRLQAAMQANLRAQATQIAGRSEKLAHLSQRLLAAFSHSLTARNRTLLALEQLRRSLGYESILQRGFALVREESGQPVRSLRQGKGKVLDIQFQDGRLRVLPDLGSKSS